MRDVLTLLGTNVKICLNEDVCSKSMRVFGDAKFYYQYFGCQLFCCWEMMHYEHK